MAELGCLEGKTLWLEVGLHCRGRGSPSWGGKGQGSGAHLSGPYLLKQVKRYGRVFLFHTLPYNEPW